MPVKIPHFYAICGRRPNQSIVVSHAVRNGEGLSKLQSRFAVDKGCNVTCVIGCTPNTPYEALRAIAKERLTRMLQLVDKGAPRPFLRA